MANQMIVTARREKARLVWLRTLHLDKRAKIKELSSFVAMADQSKVSEERKRERGRRKQKESVFWSVGLKDQQMALVLI